MRPRLSFAMISTACVEMKSTALRVVGLGYGDDEESRKLRGFFDKGNAYTLKKLQEKFVGKQAKFSKGG